MYISTTYRLQKTREGFMMRVPISTMTTASVVLTSNKNMVRYIVDKILILSKCVEILYAC